MPKETSKKPSPEESPTLSEQTQVETPADLKTSSQGTSTNSPTPSSNVSSTPVALSSPAKEDLYNAQTFSSIFQPCIPLLDETLHKGSAGRVGIIGGSRFYCGAPYYAAMSSLRLGGDLAYVICSKSAASPIKSYSPELIVCPVLDSHDAMIEINQLLPKMHSLVIGPGLGKESEIYKVITRTVELAKEQKMPIVFDADAIILISRMPELIRGYKRAILTPNAKEFDYLAGKMGLGALNSTQEPLVRDAVKALSSKLEGVVIVRKGIFDCISDGGNTAVCNIAGGPRRCGGQGDVLAGTLGLFSHWTTMAFARQKSSNPLLSPIMLAAYAACMTTRTAAGITYKQFGRSMLTTEILGQLGNVYKALGLS